MGNNNYKIVRYFQNAEIDSQVMYSGLTLEEAQDHLELPYTKEPGVWFDSYTKEISYTSYSSLGERIKANHNESPPENGMKEVWRKLGYEKEKIS